MIQVQVGSDIFRKKKKKKSRLRHDLEAWNTHIAFKHYCSIGK